MTKRTLLEHSFLAAEVENIKEIIPWCEKRASFVHSSAAEFIFWIPMFDGYKRLIKEVYGENIPELIEKKIIESVHLQAGEKDPGYLLIAFIEE